jgi:hypothetical protein
MQMRFRATPESREETIKALPKIGDVVRIIGLPEEYIVESIGMKLYKLCRKDNSNLKKTAFKKDCVRLF